MHTSRCNVIKIESDPAFQAELEMLHPSAEISVELPFKGNGNMFQVRTVVSEETFIGRASTMEEALAKCCKKAVKFIRQGRIQSSIRIHSKNIGYDCLDSISMYPCKS